MFVKLIYADERSTFAHMSGLREMLRTRGGIKKIQFDILRKMLIRYSSILANALKYS
jgi:hypothetical protein